MLTITFNGKKPSQKSFDFSVVGNAKVDTIKFILQSQLDTNYELDELVNFSSFVKIKSAGGDYLDKIPLTNKQLLNENLVLEFLMLKKTTAYREISLQLQFEDDGGEVVSQTEIVVVRLSGNINADEEIPDKYPSVLTQIENELENHEERIETLEQGGGGGSGVNGIDASFNDDELNITISKNGSEVDETNVEIPLSKYSRSYEVDEDFDHFSSELLEKIKAGDYIYSTSMESGVQCVIKNTVSNEIIFQGLERLYYYVKEDGVWVYDGQLQFLVYKTNTSSVIYANRENGNQTTIAYSVSADNNNIVRRNAEGQIIVKLTPAGVSHATSKKYVDDNVQNVREVAEGKCKSIAISCQATQPTELDYPTNTYKRIDGTYIQTWEDFREYTQHDGFGNAQFNSQDNPIDLTDYYVITVNNVVYDLERDFKTGDIVWVIELDVPDRWYNKNNSSGYVLETSKVDLSDYVDYDNLNTILERFGGYLVYSPSSTYNVGDIVLNESNSALYRCNTDISVAEQWTPAHWDAISIKDLLDEKATLSGNNTFTGINSFAEIDFPHSGGLNSLHILPSSRYDMEIKADHDIILRTDKTYSVRPYSNGDRTDLGSSSYKWNNAYIAGNLSDGTHSISVAELINGIREDVSSQISLDNESSLTIIRKEALLIKKGSNVKLHIYISGKNESGAQVSGVRFAGNSTITISTSAIADAIKDMNGNAVSSSTAGRIMAIQQNWDNGGNASVQSMRLQHSGENKLYLYSAGYSASINNDDTFIVSVDVDLAV